MVIKSIIGKLKTSNESDAAPEYIAVIKEVEPVDNFVDDFFSNIDDGGAADE